MLSRLRPKSSWVVTGLGNEFFAEPASHDGKAAEWRPMAEMVDTSRVCAMELSASRAGGGGDKGRPAWRSRTAQWQQRNSVGQCVQMTARHVDAVVCMYVMVEHRHRRGCMGAVLEDGIGVVGGAAARRVNERED